MKTLQRRTVSGTNIPPTLRLKVKLSPSGRALFATGDAGSAQYRKVWDGSEYINATGANHAVSTFVVAWSADEIYQVAVGSPVSGTTSLYLRSFDIVTGANAVLNGVNGVLNNATAILGIERIVGDTFIAYGQSRICVFRIDRTTETLVILSDIATPIPTLRGIAGSGNDNVIVVHSGSTVGDVGFQSYSVNLTTGALTAIGTKYVPGDGRINGFELRNGKVLSHSFYDLQNVRFLELDGSDALVPVPGFSSATLYANMNAVAAQTTTAFIHLAFDEPEITYLAQNSPAKFWSADAVTLLPSTAFVSPPDIPTGATNGRQNGELASRTYQAYSDDGRVMAMTFWTAAAVQGVYVYAEYEEKTAEFVADVKLPDATVDASINLQAEFYADILLPDATINLIKNSTAVLVADIKLPVAFIDSDNTIPAELVAEVKLPEAFIRDRGESRNGFMVVQVI